MQALLQGIGKIDPPLLESWDGSSENFIVPSIRPKLLELTRPLY
jgi:hypothetical protein